MVSAKPPAGGRPSRIVSVLISEPLVIIAIIINSAALFAMGFSNPGEPLDRAAFQVDYLCVIYFSVEVTLKVLRSGMRPFWRDGWNRFDFLVVAASLPVLLAPWFDVHTFGMILVLRMGRLFRLLRLLRFIPDHDRIANGIRRALRASVGVFLALFLLNVILGLGATFLFRDLAPEHFGNPLESMYSLFRVFTVEGWHEIPRLLESRAGDPGWALVARLYFVGSVTVGGILGLSLANAVFIDEMTVDNNYRLEAKVEKMHATLLAMQERLEAMGDSRGASSPEDGATR